MEEKHICGIWHAIHQYDQAKNKYTKEYDKKKESFSYLTYWGINNLYEWAMPSFE